MPLCGSIAGVATYLHDVCLEANMLFWGSVLTSPVEAVLEDSFSSNRRVARHAARGCFGLGHFRPTCHLASKHHHQSCLGQSDNCF